MGANYQVRFVTATLYEQDVLATRANARAVFTNGVIALRRLTKDLSLGLNVSHVIAYGHGTTFTNLAIVNGRRN